MIHKVRCAIYTRKSSDDGLEQDFNSLDAQHEACAAYIASQKAEGWVLVPERFDDGGRSGGTLERPALQALLTAVEDRRIDRIVVYKIDRLTRSLTDFAKIVERLDVMEASFVSVTQSFNTATSMGRLTLNMLLSFAQFEREVTAERIRDKIAASKRKGLWMGGTAPMGYRPDGRSLVIDEADARVIRQLFDLYIELGSVRRVTGEAARLGLRTRERRFATGRVTGGTSFERGHIYKILSNPVYAGRIRHHNQVFEGQHLALIDLDSWQRVQTLLQDDAARGRDTSGIAPSAPLIGKLFDDTGDGLTPTHTTKGGKRLRYYISRRLVTGCAKDHPDAWRLPATALEDGLAAILHSHLSAPTYLPSVLPRLGAADLTRLQGRLEPLLKPLQTGQAPDLLERLLREVHLGKGEIKIALDAGGFADLLSVDRRAIDTDALHIARPFQRRRRGNETRLVLGAVPATSDPTLIANICKARGWYAKVIDGQNFSQIAAMDGVKRSRVQNMIPLAFLAPDIIEAILAGTQAPGLNSEWVKRNGLPLSWEDQRAAIAAL